MYTDAILKQKWKTQKQMTKRAGYNISKLAENAHKSVMQVYEDMNLKLRYSKKPKTEHSEL